MKCPYQDIGCFYIEDVTHECEARSKWDCPHAKRDNENAISTRGYAYSWSRQEEKED